MGKTCDVSDFFTVLLGQLVDMVCGNVILAGDFNYVLCPKLDRFPPQSALTGSSKGLLQILGELDLVDIWRHHNPLLNHFTFHSNPHLNYKEFLLLLYKGDSTG
uniref:Endonuclease/exonuclease/phosphatase domain-containing protein n=1 Tax=Periophthalmus magnuspinnatus TaxID=409849 RepID=A0A3B4BBB7_9GOBI